MLYLREWIDRQEWAGSCSSGSRAPPSRQLTPTGAVRLVQRSCRRRTRPAGVARGGHWRAAVHVGYMYVCMDGWARMDVCQGRRASSSPVGGSGVNPEPEPEPEPAPAASQSQKTAKLELGAGPTVQHPPSIRVGSALVWFGLCSVSSLAGPSPPAPFPPFFFSLTPPNLQWSLEQQGAVHLPETARVFGKVARSPPAPPCRLVKRCRDHCRVFPLWTVRGQPAPHSHRHNLVDLSSSLTVEPLDASASHLITVHRPLRQPEPSPRP